MRKPIDRAYISKCGDRCVRKTLHIGNDFIKIRQDEDGFWADITVKNGIIIENQTLNAIYHRDLPNSENLNAAAENALQAYCQILNKNKE